MLDHVIIDVADIDRSRGFYEKALAPLGISLLGRFETLYAFGKEHPQFWLADRGTPPASGVHIAFQADSHEAVAEFHRAGLEAGGTDNGPPGPRPQYDENYYAAFVLDPDGNNIEAVVHHQ